ncbi:MAG TPA: DUF6662 family protein [Planctomycetota bacterium]|nr:DUF6662 family protein [Planctomycetota bacterium]
MHRQALAWAVGIGLVAAVARSADADERRFTYSYEAKTLPQGVWEFEQWATLRARKDAGVFRSWDLREEIEYGVLDRLTAALYLNWEYEAVRDVPGLDNEHEVEVETVSNEWKFKLTDPVADPVGSLLYFEWAAGEEFELETKAVLSKQVGPWVLAYNLIFEWEREEEEEPGGEEEWASEFVLSHTAGVSYEVLPGWAAGIEAVSHTEWEHNLAHSEHTAYFVGPNVHVSTARWWLTVTALKQVDLQDHRGLILDDHEKYEVRLIFGVTF